MRTKNSVVAPSYVCPRVRWGNGRRRWALAPRRARCQRFRLVFPLGDGDPHLPKGVVRLPGGVLRVVERKGGVRLVFPHNTGGTPVDLTAWHTVVQCLILVTLGALVVAGLDRLRRKMHGSRRVRTA